MPPTVYGRGGVSWVEESLHATYNEGERVTWLILCLKGVVVSEEDDVELSRGFSSKVHRMCAVGLLIGLTVAHRHVLILIEEGVCASGVEEGSATSLTETVDVLLLHLDGDLRVEI